MADSKKSSKSVSPKKNSIYQGDVIQTLSNWPSGHFDACITDPPYNIAAKRKGLKWAFSSHVTIDNEWDRFTDDEYELFTMAWLQHVCRLVKENGNIFIFGSYHNIYILGALAKRLNLKILNSIIWTKPNAQPNITCRMFTESTEQVLWLCNNSPEKATKWTFNYHHMKELNGGKQMRNYWSFPVTPKGEREHGKHPSQKPLQLMERIVLAGTNPKDKVLDCFAGSGSTLVACDRLNRHWYGIERDKEYIDIVNKRIKAENLKGKLMESLSP